MKSPQTHNSQDDSMGHTIPSSDQTVLTSTRDVIVQGGSVGVTKAYLLPKESPMHVPPHVAMSRIDDDVEHLKTQILKKM